MVSEVPVDLVGERVAYRQVSLEGRYGDRCGTDVVVVVVVVLDDDRIVGTDHDNRVGVGVDHPDRSRAVGAAGYGLHRTFGDRRRQRGIALGDVLIDSYCRHGIRLHVLPQGRRGPVR